MEAADKQYPDVDKIVDHTAAIDLEDQVDRKPHGPVFRDDSWKKSTNPPTPSVSFLPIRHEHRGSGRGGKDDRGVVPGMMSMSSRRDGEFGMDSKAVYKVLLENITKYASDPQVVRS